MRYGDFTSGDRKYFFACFLGHQKQANSSIPRLESDSGTINKVNGFFGEENPDGFRRGWPVIALLPAIGCIRNMRKNATSLTAKLSQLTQLPERTARWLPTAAPNHPLGEMLDENHLVSELVIYEGV